MMACAFNEENHISCQLLSSNGYDAFAEIKKKNVDNSNILADD